MGLHHIEIHNLKSKDVWPDFGMLIRKQTASVQCTVLLWTASTTYPGVPLQPHIITLTGN